MMTEAGGNTGYIASIQKVYSTEGYAGFYRGFFPNLTGSIIFRSLVFTVYEAAYSNMDTESLTSIIPGSGGI